MAPANQPIAPVGPVPFKDFEGGSSVGVSALPGRLSEEQARLVSTLPSSKKFPGSMTHRCYQGCWLMENCVPVAMALHQRFEPRPDDVIVASMPKCGTTWLTALAFATMARRSYPPGAADHPLRILNPHQCVPFLEGVFGSGQEAALDALPSPRLMKTHMPLAVTPRVAPTGGDGAGGGGATGCKVVYICREPKDMVVSAWHFFRRVWPDTAVQDMVGAACDGTMTYGPFWDHFLGYWRASAARPDGVLFLRYEDLLRDPAGGVRTLARFVGLPFSEAEEEAGAVCAIVELCSLDNLRGMEANRTGYVDPHCTMPREALFRKGVAGDWVNHMTPEMARRVDEIVADKLHAVGLTFP